MKKIQNLIKYTQSKLNSKVLGKKSIASLLYYIFAPFIDAKTHSDIQSRVKSLLHKVLSNKYYSGKDFLTSFFLPTFNEIFSDWANKGEPHRSNNPIYIRVDGSKTGYHYGQHIPELRKLYDYVKNARYNTHEVFVLLVSIGNIDFIVNYKIVRGECSTNAIAQELLLGFLKLFPKETQNMIKEKARLSFDGAWGNGSMITWLKDKDWQRIAVKSGGKDLVYSKYYDELLTLKEYENRTIEELNSNRKIWRKFGSCHHFGDVYFYTEVITLVNSNIQIRIVLTKFPPRGRCKRSRYLMLISLPRQNWHAFQIFKAYKNRWPIETMFRTCKQKLRLEKYRFHAKKMPNEPISPPFVTEDSIFANKMDNAFKRLETSFAFIWIGYMILNWYRELYSRHNSKSLSNAVADFETYFDSLNRKAFQQLFSPKRKEIIS